MLHVFIYIYHLSNVVFQLSMKVVLFLTLLLNEAKNLILLPVLEGKIFLTCASIKTGRLKSIRG